MGTPKPLLPWDGRALVAAQVAAMQAAGVDDVVVVTGHAAAEVEDALAASGARCVYNPGYAEGRAGSIRTGAGALGDGCACVVVLSVDQPRPSALIRAVIDGWRASGALIAVPSYQDRRGHPVVFDGSLLSELRTVDEESEGLRAVRRRHAGRTREIPVDDARALLDMNTPEAFAEARAAFGLDDGGAR
jgi:molybdenum cofactor cytidylyltransferase